jgi:rhodanese-related sulfurtransferase
MRKQKRSLILLASLTILVTIAGGGCKSTAGVTQTTTTSTASTSSGIHDISAAEAYVLIQANKANPDFKIIDIRTPDEYAAGHLENSTIIDYYADNFKAELDKLDRAKTYLIYCRTGHRSGLARDIMKGMGFLSVYNMEGGITAWQSAGYQVVQ